MSCKTVYCTYDKPLENGQYYSAMVVDNSFVDQFPITSTPVPDELVNGIPKYDWSKAEWIDISIIADPDKLVKMNRELQTIQQAIVLLTKSLADLKGVEQ